MNNQTENMYKNITTIFGYVTKANEAEAFTVTSIAMLSDFTYRWTLIIEEFDVLSRMIPSKTTYNPAWRFYFGPNDIDEQIEKDD